MNIRKVFLSLTFVLSVLVVAGCGDNKDNGNVEKLDFEINTLTKDTVCTLFGGKTGPKCQLNYSLKYASGNDADFINKIITNNLFPDVSTDTTDLEGAAEHAVLKAVYDYKANLKGVTKKSIKDGTVPVGSADFKRTVDTESKTLKDQVLVYTVKYFEQAYGMTNSVENEFTFNISLADKSVVKLENVFVPGYKDRLVGKIVGKMAEEYKTSGVEGLQSKGIFSDGMPYAPDNFIVGKDDITFVYNPFEVAGRKYGTIRICLSFDELKDIMKKEWYAFFESK